MTRTRNKAAAPTSYDVATEWMLKAERGPLSLVDEARLGAWIAEDPANAAAWRSVNHAAGLVSANAGHDQMMALRVAALAVKPEQRLRWGWGWGWGIAASVVLGIVCAGAWSVLDDRVVIDAPMAASGATYVAANETSYQTRVGQRSTFTLPDGSTVTLDTNSKVKIDFSDAERGVRLLRGQALFDVAKHRRAPFRVYAAGQTVTAVGTRFNVRIDGEGRESEVHVALIEGVVKVSPKPLIGAPQPSAKDVTLSAGELLEARAEAPVKVAAADTERLSSWRSGLLAFDDEPLGDAVAEMNRYTTRPISLSDQRLASYRLNGVFRTGDPRRFAETVTELFPVEVRDGADGGPVLSPRRETAP